MDIVKVYENSFGLAQCWRSVAFMLRDRGYMANFLDSSVNFADMWRSLGYQGEIVSILDEDEPRSLKAAKDLIEFCKVYDSQSQLSRSFLRPIPHANNGTCSIIRMHWYARSGHGISMNDLKYYNQESTQVYTIEVSPGMSVNFQCRSLILILRSFQYGTKHDLIQNANIAYQETLTSASVPYIEIFYFSELRINPTKHYLTPNYRVLSSEEIEILMNESSRILFRDKKPNSDSPEDVERFRVERFQIFAKSLRFVYNSDALCKWLGIPPNSIVESTSIDIQNPMGNLLVDYLWVKKDNRWKSDKQKKTEGKAKLKEKKGFTPQ